MKTNTINLYKKTATGDIQHWQIHVKDWDIHIHYGKLGGAMQDQIERVPEGLGGRTRREQVISRVKSRINKQKDKGYVTTVQEAQSKPVVNSMGLPKPMLAQSMKRFSGTIDPKEWWVQYKYDGHRCIITRQQGELVAYSRNGKPINTIDHVLIELDPYIGEGDFFDGELYHHGTKLQTIASWIKRDQENTKNLQYIIFDTIRPEPFKQRVKFLQNMRSNIQNQNAICLTSIQVAMTISINEITKAISLNGLLKMSVEAGYEGLILRDGAMKYETDKRSKGLVKFKQFYDEEFKVIDIAISRDGWGVLVCITNGKPPQVFKVSAPGTVGEKMTVIENPDEYVGRMVNVQYSMLTNDGVPFHPVATGYRDD